MLCDRCGVELKPGLARLSYLGNNFEQTLPVCPVCGQVYISEELALGKMARVEEDFEEK